MKKRTQPFGYSMKHGQIEPADHEAGIVQYIFRAYCQGMTFDALADKLNQGTVEYHTGSPWNKNMVARILADRRYQGSEEYPALVENTLFQAAEQQRKKRQSPRNRTEAQRLLCRLGVKKHPEAAEQRVRLLLNQLIQRPEQIQIIAAPSAEADCRELEQHLMTAMNQQPVDEKQTNELLLALAQRQYRCIPDSEYETVRLRHLFEQAQPMETLDVELLREAVAEVFWNEHGSIEICLKNHQRIGDT